MTSNGRLNFRDMLFIRLDKRGIPIAGSAIWRRNIPKGQGIWKDITNVALTSCSTTTPDQKSYVLFRNTTGSSNITEIAFNGYHWIGTLANNGYLMVELPANQDVEISITTSAFSGRTITTSTVQGTGTISAIGVLASNNSTTTISQTPASQYLIILS